MCPIWMTYFFWRRLAFHIPHYYNSGQIEKRKNSSTNKRLYYCWLCCRLSLETEGIDVGRLLFGHHLKTRYHGTQMAMGIYYNNSSSGKKFGEQEKGGGFLSIRYGQWQTDLCTIVILNYRCRNESFYKWKS